MNNYIFDRQGNHLGCNNCFGFKMEYEENGVAKPCDFCRFIHLSSPTGKTVKIDNNYFNWNGKHIGCDYCYGCYPDSPIMRNNAVDSSGSYTVACPKCYIVHKFEMKW